MVDVNGNTHVCGLIGNPVGHTMSPLIHNYFAKALGQNMVYVPFHVDNGQLEAAIKGAYGLNIYGMNVTVPYKNDVIPYLADINEMAEKIGAVNTLVRIDGGYKGYNTDISGLFHAMKSEGIVIAQEEILILGAGGVGRSAAFMCAANGAKKVYLLNRNVDKAERVAEEVNCALSTNCVVPMALEDYGVFAEGARQHFLVIQCTSVGLYPNGDNAVIEDSAFYLCAKVGYDLIYTPWETKFMKLVKAAGGKAYNGLKMFLYQAVDAFELWNGCKIPDESVYKAYEKIQESVRNVKS